VYFQTLRKSASDHEKEEFLKEAVLMSNARGMDFACFYEFSIGFWNCSNSEVFFVFQPIKILTESPLDVRRYDNRSPPSINSSIINCG
jgi:hypothetical protein